MQQAPCNIRYDTGIMLTDDDMIQVLSKWHHGTDDDMIQMLSKRHHVKDDDTAII